MLYDEATLKQILDKTDLVELIGRHVTLKANGKRWWGRCPFHEEKSPSFTVNPSQQFFYCFGCQEKGNAFGFVMKHDHLTFPEAVKQLASSAGVALAEAAQQTPQDKERAGLSELLGRLAGTFAHLLKNHPEAKEARVLLATRGVSNEMVEKFQLGYALREWGWMKTFLIEKKYTPDFIVRSGLFSSQNPDAFLFGGRLLFPIKVSASETVGFGGRLLGNNTGPKYINSPETAVFLKRRSLYAWDQALPSIRERQQAILCEGYMDAIALHQAGLTWAVAPLGTAFTEEQAQLLKRYCRSVICLFDNDAAGQKATTKVIEICEPLELTTFVAKTQGSKDPSELLEKEGPQALQRLLEEPKKGFDFLVDYRYTAYSGQASPDLRGFLGEIFGFLAKIGNGTLRETFLNSLADFLGVSRSTLVEDFQKGDFRRTGKLLDERTPLAPNVVDGGSRSAEWMLMMAVLTKPELFGRLRRDLSPESFFEARSRRLFEVVDALIVEGTDLVIEAVLIRVGDEDWVDDLVRTVMSGELESIAERVLEDGLLYLKKKKLTLQRKRVGERLRQVAGDAEETHRLMQEILFLDREITRLKGNV
jgi:DNA primase